MSERPSEARDRFRHWLSGQEAIVGEPLAEIPEASERLSAGWAFFYQSRRYVETRDVAAMLVGHGPVVVCDDGRIIEGGSLDRDAEAML